MLPAAAQVAHDELQVLPFHPLLCPLGQIFDGCAVEAVAANVIVTGNLDRNGIIVRLRRHGAVERRFERADERRTGQQRTELPDGGEIRRIVRGCDGAERLHAGKHIVRQNLHAAYALCQHDLEAHAVQRGQIGKNRVGQLPQHTHNGLAVRGEDSAFVGQRTVFMRFGVKPPLARADTLSPAGSQHKLLRHTEQLVFQRRTADIADQNIHSVLLAFFYTVTDGAGIINTLHLAVHITDSGPERRSASRRASIYLGRSIQ